MTYEREAAEDKNKESATKLKKVVVEIINGKLVRYLTGMSSVDDETYGQFARTIGKIIDDNNEVVKKRRKNENPPDETKDE